MPKLKAYPNDHTAIVAMVNEYGFAGVVRALSEQASRRAISWGDRQHYDKIAALLADCANEIEQA